MRFDTAQVLEIVNISTETLRHWKRVLEPIRARDGRSQGYTFQELLALAVIAKAVHDLEVPISRFKAFASYLFQDVSVQGSDRHLRVLCITPTEMVLTSIETLPESPALAIVRIEPILQALRGAIGMEMEAQNSQLSLPLGPTLVAIRPKKI
jgi:DNA-binding transcriptional MerR regulator